MCNYNNGKIYILYNTITDVIYVGATTRLLHIRLAEHKRNSQNIKYKHRKLYIYFNEHGAEHFKIELLENYNCNNKMELYAKEAKYIRELNPFLNTQIGGATQKRYYQNNKEKIAEQEKQYKQNNKDKIAEQNKQYRQVNKEKIAEQKTILPK